MPTELTRSGCFVLLASRRRRLLLRTLRERGPPTSIREIAERITECEHGSTTADDLRKVRQSLYHNHLPRLEEADVLSYDWEERTVEALRPNFDTLVQLLERADERDAPCIDA